MDNTLIESACFAPHTLSNDYVKMIGSSNEMIMSLKIDTLSFHFGWPLFQCNLSVVNLLKSDADKVSELKDGLID